MSGAGFWNGILADHAASQVRATKTVTPSDTYRGWSISFDYGEWSATSPNYDAWTEGEGDWVDNGQRVVARKREWLIEEVDAWFEEHGE